MECLVGGGDAFGACDSGRRERRTLSYVVPALVERLSSFAPTPGMDSATMAFSSLFPRLWPMLGVEPIETVEETVLVRLGAKEADDMV